MHLQQTKLTSRATGGPQYYFHSVPPHVKDYLRRRGSCPVVLQTPYGITSSPLLAVGRDHKLAKSGEVVSGRVGHDRIQGVQSIGEEIRHWYALEAGRDFERIEVEVEIHPQGHFILIPIGVAMRKNARPRALEKVAAPLSFHRDHQSKLWRRQLESCRRVAAADLLWAGDQIRRVVADHGREEARHVHEADWLRAAGALSVLGLQLGPYLTKGYDCPHSRFTFAGYPGYPCPVEIKKRSSRFDYQITRYDDLPRAVVLCVEHDLVNAPSHVDVIELTTLAQHLP